MINDPKKEIRKQKFQIEIMDFIRMILISIVFVFFCISFLFHPVTVDGSSMYPTLIDQERGFSSVLSTFTSSPKRFEIVVVEHEEEKKGKMETELWVKRVIGLPGEKIEYKDGKLYVNDKYVKENFLNKEYVAKQTNNGEHLFTNDFGPIVVEEGSYFLMGDNRLVSKDSRYVGAFKEKSIVSKYVLVFYPFDKVGYIKNGSK